MTRRAKETVSHNALRRDNEMIWIKAWPWRFHHGIRQQIRFVLILLFSLWQYVETYFAEKDTIFVFKIFYEVLGGGTRLAMPKTICTLDSSSLKPGSGATEGVPD